MKTLIKSNSADGKTALKAKEWCLNYDFDLYYIRV